MKKKKEGYSEHLTDQRTDKLVALWVYPVSLIGDAFYNELELFGFSGEGKTRVPGEKPLNQSREDNNSHPHKNHGVVAETRT